MRETELLPFDDSLLKANVPVLTNLINRVPHEDGPTRQEIKGAHEGWLDEYARFFVSKMSPATGVTP